MIWNQTKTEVSRTARKPVPTGLNSTDSPARASASQLRLFGRILQPSNRERPICPALSTNGPTGASPYPKDHDTALADPAYLAWFHAAVPG
jgi:hypothetical protein